MYTVINRTKKERSQYVGTFPHREAVELLEAGNDIIVVSTYTNTIKVPFLDESTNNYGETKSSHDWLFKDYEFAN